MPSPEKKEIGNAASGTGASDPPAAQSAVPRCPVCSTELANGRCPQCEASALVQQAYLDISEVQGRGINVEEAVALLQRARELLEEKDYTSVDDFIQGARHIAAEAETSQGPLRKALDRAAGALEELKRSGKDTHRLEQAIRRATKFLEEGDLEGARLLVKRLPAFIRELQGSPVVDQQRPSAPDYLSTCPKCSKQVMRSWQRCPFCLAQLEAPAPPDSPTAT